MKKFALLLLFPAVLFTSKIQAQIDESQTGAWYMYFWNTQFGESRFGMQGDLQYRNWDLGGDLEQMLLRGGFTYTPKNANIKFTLGYAHIITGDFGPSSEFTVESRIYQEALLPHKLSDRFYLAHRFRYEQRFMGTQDMRTRFRYNLFLNVPLNQANLNKNAIYIALYNELFINGEREFGGPQRVALFDRNRFYSALGYAIKDNLKVQAGYMQQTTDIWSKGQLQLSLHHNF
ncbi:DUF2490 domain-containing protein [Salegentibacter sp. HM20]